MYTRTKQIQIRILPAEK